MRQERSSKRAWQRPLSEMCRRAAWLLIVVSAGCGEGGPELAPAAGTVTFRGQPVPFGSVQFQPISGGQYARGDIQADGSFSLSTAEVGEGAAVGRHRVRITSFESQNPRKGPDFQPGADEPVVGRSRIPRHYSSFGTSGLEVEVKPDSNAPFTFELTDAR